MQAIQLANEMHVRQQQLGQEQQRIGLAQQAQPSEIAQREAQTANVQAQTAAGLPAAQSALTQANTEKTRLENALAEETNPLQKGLLQSQVNLADIKVKQAQSQLDFFGHIAGNPTPGAPGTGFDAVDEKTRKTLGTLAPHEKALLDAASETTQFEGRGGNPEALKTYQGAVQDIANGRNEIERSKVYAQLGMNRSTADYLDTSDNSIKTMTPGEFLAAAQKDPNRLINFTPTIANSLKAQGQVNDIYDGIKNMRSVLNDPKFQFTAQGRTLMAAAQRDPTVLTAALSGEAAKALSPQERNYFVAVQTLVERGMSLRGLQGQGAGSDAQREAIVRLLPGLLDADPKMAKQKVDQFQNNVDNLNKMIPKIGPQSKTSATEAAQPKVLNFDAQGNLIQ